MFASDIVAADSVEELVSVAVAGGPALPLADAVCDVDGATGTGGRAVVAGLSACADILQDFRTGGSKTFALEAANKCFGGH